MCGRFSLSVPAPEIETRFGVEIPESVDPRYNIAPRDEVLAVRNDRPDTATRLRWGLVPRWVDDPTEYSQPINARAETVDEKPFFQDAFEQRRCLVLADGFYEWKGDRGSKSPYRIERVDGEPFAFAGLWDTWEGNGETIRSCTVLTREPTDTIAPLHHRMAVMLEPHEEREWLESGTKALLSSTNPYPDGELTAYRVSDAVNDPTNDAPAITEPVEDPQSGLGEFV